MCGICGILNADESMALDPDVLRAMNQTLIHRGPDGGDIYHNHYIGMGHRRLSIIDIDSGKQPLSNEDGTVWVSFNGEIYNYLELIPGLKAKGHQFRTKSDTEVLVHLYEEKGIDMLADLRGMFAFSIWDEKNKRLFIARDRVGKKPLYYYNSPGKHFIYGSEIKALLASNLIPREVNYKALDQYLSFLYVPTPESIFAGIKKLPAGHYLTVENGKLNIEQYWDLQFSSPQEPYKSEEYYSEKFEEILTEAVKIRLRSDVPLGAFLSGGIDSSAIVSVMSDINPGKVETVSIGFSEDEYNELPYAKQISELFNCHYNEIIVTSETKDIIPELIGFFDEPFADPSFIPTYYVSKGTRQKVTVALSGDGGDETLAGYSRHSIELLEHKLRKFTRFLPSSILAKLYQILPEGTKGRNILGDLSCAPDEAAARKHYNVLFTHLQKKQLYMNNLMHSDFSERFRKLYNGSSANNILDKILHLDVKTYLTDDILVKVDRMSMAVSLECRAPLLDHKLLEFLATVPPDLKLNNGTTKYLLKKLLRKKVPSTILDRKKQGFRLPIEVWLKNELKEFTEDIILGKTFHDRGLFNRVFVEKMWSDFITGRRDYAHHIWQLLILEVWFQKYIDC